MVSQYLKQAFAAVVGAQNVMDAEADKHAYSYDAAVLEPVLPALVVRPQEMEQVGKIVTLCNDNGLPLTVRGAGSNLSGGTIPSKGGIVLLTNALTRILEINDEDMYAVVQTGVVTAKFAAAVAAKGLFYPPDPGSQAVSTLGGNVAENAGGLRGLKYGVTKDYVMGVNFFDNDGNYCKSGSKTVKCVTGLNIPQLMVGSEGTLAMMTEFILKLVPPPLAAKSMMAIFPDVMSASRTVSAIIAAKVVPCTLEFMDNFTIGAVEGFAKVGLPTDAGSLLLIEVDGHPAQVAEEAEKVEAICKQHGCTRIQVAKDAAERNKVWEARRAALSSLARLRPTTVLEDATVPHSKIPAMMEALDKIAKEFKLTIGTFGHAGDGNLHPTILCDRRNKEEFHRVEKGVDAIFEAALALDGTLSGEHGIGLAKSRYLEKETNKASVLFSKRIKKACDPNNVLNPGKILGNKTMADLNQMLKLLGELDDQLVACMRCGMCQSVCPVFAETGREADVARGKIALLEFLGRDMIKDAAAVKERLDKCLLCGSCAAACPSGVKALDIFLKARAIITSYIGLSPAKKAIFRGMLAKPKLFNSLLALGGKLQGFFTTPVNDIIGSSCSKFLSPLLGDRHILPLADKPLRAAGNIDTPPGASGLKVAFFYGCMVDKMFPGVGQSMLKVFKHHGVGVFMPVEQVCCGVPSLASGDMQSFMDLVRMNLKLFGARDFDYVVTPCGTCTSAFHHIWPLMCQDLSQAEREQVRMLAGKAMDINAFIADKLGVTPVEQTPGARKVTIHDPCHLKKSLGVSRQVRTVIGANPGLTITEMAASDVCCGCGGSFNLQHYGVSAQIGKKKRDSIEATGADIVAAGCPACMMQIADMLSQAGDRIEVKHPVELYAQTLG